MLLLFFISFFSSELNGDLTAVIQCHQNQWLHILFVRNEWCYIGNASDITRMVIHGHFIFWCSANNLSNNVVNLVSSNWKIDIETCFNVRLTKKSNYDRDFFLCAFRNLPSWIQTRKWKNRKQFLAKLIWTIEWFNRKDQTRYLISRTNSRSQISARWKLKFQNWTNPIWKKLNSIKSDWTQLFNILSILLNYYLQYLQIIYYINAIQLLCTIIPNDILYQCYPIILCNNSKLYIFFNII